MARLSTTFFSLLALLALLFLASPATAQSEVTWQAYRVQCYRKSPSIIAAIDKFCSRNDIVVPSNYGDTGAYSGTAQVNLWANGNCLRTGRISAAHPVWVPAYWCKRQFWYTCAHGPNKGTNDAMFGGLGCQQFHTQTS